MTLQFDIDQMLLESSIATPVSVTICVGQYIKSYLERERMTILIAEKIKAIWKESLKDWKKNTEDL